MAGAIDIFVVGKSQRQSSAVGGGIYGWSLCLPIKRRQAFKRRQPLEQFQLLNHRIVAFLLLTEENFHTAELLVGDA